jgi:Asp-tRNA(Asn)/Glu-tRNA(Gln) amidotransferase A subunit family amidase
MKTSAAILFAALCMTAPHALFAAPPATRAMMDRDLVEVTIPKLEEFYATHRYTVRQVTQWYLDRIARFDPRYRAVITVNGTAALAAADAEDAAAAKAGKAFKPGAMFGVPMIIKSNTSIQGLVTNDGWKGFMIPGHELVAPQDATVVKKLRAAGAILIGQSNMPDFAASDTNKSSAFGRTGNAYDARFSPGGSSGGTVTAVTANFAEMGTGTDTSNSIRMPSGTSAVVGVLPTRGLVSIAGIAPLDWLLDNTGPIARNVTDAAIALGVMAGEDAKDFRTKGSAAKAQAGPYTQYLKADSLKGKRFGVPAFIIAETPTAAAGAGPSGMPMAGRSNAMRPETRELFMKALDDLRAAGATIVMEDDLLPASFTKLTQAIGTRTYHREGMEAFLRDFGPAEYRSIDAYAAAVGTPLPATLTGAGGRAGATPSPQVDLETDPAAEATFFAPQRAALEAYNEGLEKYHLDGYVYPALYMPPNDETIPQPDGRPSSGPHSNTGWVNRIGVPAVVVPCGFYATGLPMGMEMSARQWQDGTLLGFAYGYEQATAHRQPPVLVEELRPEEKP